MRLTGSGLGCHLAALHRRVVHTARCPGRPLGDQFGNRTLTFVLVAIAVATFLATLRSGRRDLLGLSVLARRSASRPGRVGGSPR